MAQLERTRSGLEEDVRLARLALDAKENRLAEFLARLATATESLRTDRRGRARGPRAADAGDADIRLLRNNNLREITIRVLNDGLARSPASILVAARKIGYESTASPATQSTMIRGELVHLAKTGVLRKAGHGRYAKP